MKLEVRNGRDNKPIVKLPNGVIGIVDSRDHANVEAGKEYEFMITGYSKKLAASGFPASVFVRVAGESNMLVEARQLTCSGSMCSTSSDFDLNGKFCNIYPGHNYPGFVADEVNADFYNLPRYPARKHMIWINYKNPSKSHAVGVDSYDDLAPCVAALDTFKSVTAVREARHHSFLDRISDGE